MLSELDRIIAIEGFKEQGGGVWQLGQMRMISCNITQNKGSLDQGSPIFGCGLSMTSSFSGLMDTTSSPIFLYALMAVISSN